MPSVIIDSPVRPSSDRSPHYLLDWHFSARNKSLDQTQNLVHFAVAGDWTARVFKPAGTTGVEFDVAVDAPPELVGKQVLAGLKLSAKSHDGPLMHVKSVSKRLVKIPRRQDGDECAPIVLRMKVSEEELFRRAGTDFNPRLHRDWVLDVRVEAAGESDLWSKGFLLASKSKLKGDTIPVADELPFVRRVHFEFPDGEGFSADEELLSFGLPTFKTLFATNEHHFILDQDFGLIVDEREGDNSSGDEDKTEDFSFDNAVPPSSSGERYMAVRGYQFSDVRALVRYIEAGEAGALTFTRGGGANNLDPAASPLHKARFDAQDDLFAPADFIYPKPAYALASLLGLSETFKHRCLDGIRAALTVRNAPVELRHPFAARYPAIRQVIVDFMQQRKESMSGDDRDRCVRAFSGLNLNGASSAKGKEKEAV
ncbi:hypothetical protein JCM6882_003909 [Rhodosporidiobolus microsporus]